MLIAWIFNTFILIITLTSVAGFLHACSRYDTFTVTLVIRGRNWKSFGRKNGKKHTTKMRELDFGAPHLKNITVPQGQDVAFSCKVVSKSTGKTLPLQLVWIRLDTQTILAIEKQVVQDNPRITADQPDRLEFTLHIKNAQPEDSGFYACRLNTKPFAQMKAALDVLVPPVIIAADTTETILTHEENDVTLKCKATGHPAPLISWKREDGGLIRSRGQKVYTYRGSVLFIPRITRDEMATYVCMADNNVPPAVSQRISVNVAFAPKIYLEPKYRGIWKGGSLELKCEVEAFPLASVLWYQDSIALSNSDKYELRSEVPPAPGYRTKTTLMIKRIDEEDFKHAYTCAASNTNGNKEEIAKLHEVEQPKDDQEMNSLTYDGQQMDDDAAAGYQNSKGNPKRKSPNGKGTKEAGSWHFILGTLMFLCFSYIGIDVRIS